MGRRTRLLGATRIIVTDPVPLVLVSSGVRVPGVAVAVPVVLSAVLLCCLPLPPLFLDFSVLLFASPWRSSSSRRSGDGTSDRS
jgi:hypothetical protein